MADLTYPIAYLETHDFDERGDFVFPKKAVPTLVMIQAGWCGACAGSKPDFQRFADMEVVSTATIQEDGERDSEKLLGKRIGEIYPEKFVGFPSYMLILPSGKKIAYNGNRDPDSLKKFVELHM